MNITDVRVRLMESTKQSKLLGFCSITIDGDFVVRDLKIIDGTNGPFVAMANRKVQDRCPSCGARNNLKARYCGDCGARLADNRVPRDARGRAAAHVDIAHPITTECRRYLEERVVEEYRKELEQSKSPNYKPRTLEGEEGDTDMGEETNDQARGESADFGAGIFS
ncbi:MAG: SpoVG family protein [Planctomycetota bacterium]